MQGDYHIYVELNALISYILYILYLIIYIFLTVLSQPIQSDSD